MAIVQAYIGIADFKEEADDNDLTTNHGPPVEGLKIHFNVNAAEFKPNTLK